MARLIPASERIARARALIQQARNIPLSTESGWQDFSYVAEVKDLFRQARDLVKFITYRPGASPEMKNEVANLLQEVDLAEKEILHK